MSFIQDVDFPFVGESAQCFDYTFEPDKGVVRINDEGFLGPLLIINSTVGEVLFNPSKPARTGVTSGNRVTLTLDTTSMSASDDLLIICAVDRHSHTLLLLENILEELKIQNKLLVGISE